MKDKKILYISLLIIGALLIALGLFLSNKFTSETLPDIEQVEQVEEATNEEQEESVKEESVQNEEAAPTEHTKTLFPSKPKPKAAAPKINPTFVKEAQEQSLNENTSDNTQRKLTPEEEALIKKVPPSKEIVVDKEIKIKSSGKYFFK